MFSNRIHSNCIALSQNVSLTTLKVSPLKSPAGKEAGG